MCILTHRPDCASGTDLQRMIEPLASYICATDKPKATLMSALSVLFDEVAQTNKAANALLSSFSEHA